MKMMWLFVGLALALSVPVRAQSVANPDSGGAAQPQVETKAVPRAESVRDGGPPGGGDAPLFSATAFGQWVSRADVDGGGSFSVMRGEVSLQRGIATLSYRQDVFDWSDAQELEFSDGSGEPWQELHTLSLDLNKVGFLDPQLMYILGGTLGAGFENDMDGSFGANVRAGLGYALSPQWMVNGGLILFWHPAERMAFPFLGLDYNRFATEGFSATIGMPSTEARYRFGPSTQLRTALTLSGGVWRLADDSPVRESGYASLRDVTWGLYLDLSPWQGMEIVLGGEYFLWRELTTYDRRGNRKDEIGLDDALGGSLAVTYTF